MKRIFGMCLTLTVCSHLLFAKLASSSDHVHLLKNLFFVFACMLLAYFHLLISRFSPIINLLHAFYIIFKFFSLGVSSAMDCEDQLAELESVLDSQVFLILIFFL
jgi:hypothetical protein